MIAPLKVATIVEPAAGIVMIACVLVVGKGVHGEGDSTNCHNTQPSE